MNEVRRHVTKKSTLVSVYSTPQQRGREGERERGREGGREGSSETSSDNQCSTCSTSP